MQKQKVVLLQPATVHMHGAVQWCRRGECKRTTKNLDLSKIREKSLKFCAKSLKIWAKMTPNLVLTSKYGAQRLQINKRRPFFWRSHKKSSSWSLWEKICCGQKTHNFWASLGKFGQKFLLHPQTFGCSSYTCGVVRRRCTERTYMALKLLLINLES